MRGPPRRSPRARRGRRREARKWRRTAPPPRRTLLALLPVYPRLTRADLDKARFAVGAKRFDGCSRTCYGVSAGDNRCRRLPSESAVGVERTQTSPGLDPRPPLVSHIELWLLGTAGRCDRQALED